MAGFNAVTRIVRIPVGLSSSYVAKRLGGQCSTATANAIDPSCPFLSDERAAGI